MVFLYTRLPDYFNECINNFSSEQHLVILKDRDDDAPYLLSHKKHVTILNRNELNWFWIKRILADETGHIFCAGWSDKMYLFIVLLSKLRNFYTTIGMDNQYTGLRKQKFFIGSMLSRVITTIFDSAMVPGIRQHHYALRMGFKESNIYGNLYVASQRFRDKIELSLVANRVISVGRLVPYKNFDKLIRAISLLNLNDVNYYLRIVGSGPEEEKLKNLAKELGIESMVEFIAFVQPQDLPKLFEGCSLFALLSDIEAHGLVVHEASCLGIPLMVTKGVGAGDLFVDDSNGYVLDKPSPELIAENLLEYFNLPLETKNTMKTQSMVLGGKVNSENWKKSLLDIRSA